MKTCKNCLREFDEAEALEDSPAQEFCDVFISDIGNVDDDDLCPVCREELGLMNLMGFRP